MSTKNDPVIREDKKSANPNRDYPPNWDWYQRESGKSYKIRPSITTYPSDPRAEAVVRELEKEFEF